MVVAGVVTAFLRLAVVIVIGAAIVKVVVVMVVVGLWCWWCLWLLM